MKRILLIGGSGTLGSQVLIQLEKTGHDFAAPSSSEMDAQSKAALSEFANQFKPDLVINCAAWTNVDGAEAKYEEALMLNSGVIQNLIELSDELNFGIVHVSTDYVFDGESKTPYSESDRTNPINAYGKSKLQGEIKLQEKLKKDSFIIRTSWLYGPVGKNFVKIMIRKALRGENAQVVDDQFGSPTNALDLAAGIVTLMEGTFESGVYHFSNLGECSWFEFAQEIYRLVGADPDLVVRCKTSEIHQVTHRPKYSVLSKEKWIQSGVSTISCWQESLESSIASLVKEARDELSR